MPSTQELLDYAANYRVGRNIDYYINETDHFSLLNPENFAVLEFFKDRASREANSSRVVTMKLRTASSSSSSYLLFEVTNAQLVALVDSVALYMQESFDAERAIVLLINNSTITTYEQIDDMWLSAVATAIGVNHDFRTSTQAHIADAATNAATNAPTSLNVLTTLLGGLTGEVNATNTKQNDLATKYNDLATKFNSLLDKMEALTLLATS